MDVSGNLEEAVRVLDEIIGVLKLPHIIILGIVFFKEDQRMFGVSFE